VAFELEKAFKRLFFLLPSCLPNRVRLSVSGEMVFVTALSTAVAIHIAAWRAGAPAWLWAKL
jgi:hypothetical protein